jgi:hypothetical protein
MPRPRGCNDLPTDAVAHVPSAPCPLQPKSSTCRAIWQGPPRWALRPPAMRRCRLSLLPTTAAMPSGGELAGWSR